MRACPAQRLSGADFACAGADLERVGRGAGQLDRGTSAGTHSFFAAVDGTRAGGAGDAGRRGSGSRAGSGSRIDAMELETAGTYLNENFRGGRSSGYAPRWRGAWRWNAKRTGSCWHRLKSFAARVRWRREGVPDDFCGRDREPDHRRSRTGNGCGRCCWRWKRNSGWWNC